MTNRDKIVTTTVSEMRFIVRAAAEPFAPGDSVKAAIGRAARRLGISHRRAVTYWYGRTCAVRAEEADQLRAWHAAYVAQEARRLELKLNELRARQKAFEERINATRLAMAGGAADGRRDFSHLCGGLVSQEGDA